MFRLQTCVMMVLILVITTSLYAQSELKKQLRIMVIGAHPDDAESAGGLVAKYAALGHKVKLVSLTNGDAGHHEIGGRPLALRRAAEARRSGAVIGAEYILLDNHDGELMPSWELRKQLIQLMRAFEPDLIITHRTNDYHPDHRYTGVLVRDAYTELSVAGNVALTPYLKKFPVLMYMSDNFTKPYPFIPDIVIDIEETLDKKIDMYHCHESQMYEWIPYIQGRIDQVPNNPDERRAWLAKEVKAEVRKTADQYRDKLIAFYGEERAKKIKYAEAFEISEYTLHITKEKLKKLFPFLKIDNVR